MMSATTLKQLSDQQIANLLSAPDGGHGGARARDAVREMNHSDRQ